VAHTELRTGLDGRQVPVFLDSSGRRWLWFRFFAIAAIAICTFGFVSVVVGAYRTPALPSLELPYQPKLHAIPSLSGGATAAAESATTLVE
jgi:hypothetical protein